jgi:8-oxo-dGTP pyrophosphatase MutT (NUDIX family)
MTHATDAGGPRTRRTARILVLDEQGAILLLKTHWGVRTRPARWLTPGGGIDAGEDAHTAAVRELFEETGVRVETLGDPVAHRVIPLPPVEEYQAREATYFVLRGPRFAITSTEWTDSEKDDIVDVRWFAPEELAASTDDFDPEDVRGILAELRDQRPAR